MASNPQRLMRVIGAAFHRILHPSAAPPLVEHDSEPPDPQGIVVRRHVGSKPQYETKAHKRIMRRRRKAPLRRNGYPVYQRRTR